MSVNKVILLGRLGQDPEILSGGAVRMSLATSERWTDASGQPVEKTQWHSLVAFGKTGEVMSRYLRKGSQVYVEGAIEYFKKDDKYYTSIKVFSFSFVGDGGGNVAAAEPTVANDEKPFITGKSSRDDDDLPF